MSGGDDRQVRLEAIARELLAIIDPEPERPGLQETPRRWAKMWLEFIDYDPGVLDTTFEMTTTDQMVVVSGMRVSSCCEHHLMNFVCDIAVGYITDGVGSRVLGLSKFGRIAHKHAHKLQIQERLVQDIADDVQEITGTQSVAVLARGEHSCMALRGIKTPHLMTSSAMRGAFRGNDATRAEFLKLAMP